jgi:hypothetical protein
MKKYLLPIILSLMLLAVPVTADAPYRLVVDGVLVDKPVVIIDGVSYAPIRAVADIFEATTDWDGATGTISIAKKGLERPLINGDAEFTAKINEALDILEQGDFPHYVMVCENINDIATINTNPTGLEDALAFHVAGSIRATPILLNDSKRYTPMFLSGVLVHEATHAVNWQYDRELSEKESYAHELAVFKLLDAPQWMQNECINRT